MMVHYIMNCLQQGHTHLLQKPSAVQVWGCGVALHTRNTYMRVATPGSTLVFRLQCS